VYDARPVPDAAQNESYPQSQKRAPIANMFSKSQLVANNNAPPYNIIDSRDACHRIIFPRAAPPRSVRGERFGNAAVIVLTAGLSS